MDAVSQERECTERFLNLVAIPLEETPGDPLGEPLAELAFTADYELSEVFTSRKEAERQALEHNGKHEACPESGWLLVAKILEELETASVQVRPDGQGGGTLEVTRSYSFRLMCSSVGAEETLLACDLS